MKKSLEQFTTYFSFKNVLDFKGLCSHIDSLHNYKWGQYQLRNIMPKLTQLVTVTNIQ